MHAVQAVQASIKSWFNPVSIRVNPIRFDSICDLSSLKFLRKYPMYVPYIYLCTVHIYTPPPSLRAPIFPLRSSPDFQVTWP